MRELSGEQIRVDVDGGIAVVTLDAPPVNAVTLAMYERLTEIFTGIAQGTDVRCVVLTGAGERVFCAGADLRELGAQEQGTDHKRQAIGLATFEALEACPVPVIAAVNGPALGAGTVFASLCDIRLAVSTATFGLPEINVGRAGGAAFLAQQVPPGWLRLMFYTGDPISAQEAYRLGMVQEVTQPERLMPRALEIAAKIAAKSPAGIRACKESLREIHGLSALDGYRKEQDFSVRLFDLDDSREALNAFLEKREPNFSRH